MNMWKTFNSRIFTVAVIPFVLYVFISIFVFVSSGFELSIFEPLTVISLSLGTVIAALFFSFKHRILHYLAMLVLLILGGFGVYNGMSASSTNWIEVIFSACIIAFSIAMFEFVTHHHQDK